MLGLLNQLMTVGELWTAGASHAGDSFSLSLGRQGATGFPLLTTWDSVAGLGRAPIPENISGRKLTRVLNSVGSVLVHLRYVTKRPRTGEGCDPGNSGVWDRDYGWGVRVRRPFGARGMSSVRYGTVCVFITAGPFTKLCAWGRRRVEDMCYEIRRAEACVD